MNGEDIEDYLEHNTDKFLGVENTYEGYAQLVKDLGLEIPESYERCWEPTQFETFFYISGIGEVIENEKNKYYFEKFVINYNAFPTRELAEKAVNLSKLGRLILLWQYVNDYLFEPNWLDIDQSKYHIIYSNMYSEMKINVNYTIRQDKSYFETEEQAQAFINMYEKEIKEIMGISQC